MDFTITATDVNKSEIPINTDQEECHDAVEAPVNMTTDLTEKTSPVSITTVLSEHNLNVIQNDNNSHLSISEESNSSICEYF